MGVLCTIFLIVCFLWGKYHDIKDGMYRGAAGKKAEAEGKEYYYDYKGTYRTIDDHKVFVYPDPHTGDVMEYDYKTKTTINKSLCDRLEELRKAEETGFPSAIRWTNCERSGLPNPLIKSYKSMYDVYRDVKTGKLMYCVPCNEGYCFADAETLKFVRFTDEYIQLNRCAKAKGYEYYGASYLKRHHNTTFGSVHCGVLQLNKYTINWKWPHMSIEERTKWIQDHLKTKRHNGMEVVYAVDKSNGIGPGYMLDYLRDSNGVLYDTRSERCNKSDGYYEQENYYRKIGNRVESVGRIKYVVIDGSKYELEWKRKLEVVE